MEFYGDIDLNQNELIRAVLENSSATPTGGLAGQIYYDTDTNKIMVYNGSTWVEVGSGGGGGGDISDGDKGDITVSGSGFTWTIDDGAVTPSKLSFDPATQTELDAHVNDTTDAHDASAISFSPTGSISATDVQAAIAEVASETSGGGIVEAVGSGDGISVDDTDPANPEISVNSTVLRDTDIGSAVQAHSTTLDATDAAFTTTKDTKLSGIEAGAEVNDTAAEILTKLLTVDGLGSGLDADTLDGLSSAGFAPAISIVGTSLGTTGTVDLDMTALNGTIQWIVATGDITFTTSNRAAGCNVRVFIDAGASTRTLAYPAWIAHGVALPTSLASGKRLALTVLSLGTTDANISATASAQP